MHEKKKIVKIIVKIMKSIFAHSYSLEVGPKGQLYITKQENNHCICVKGFWVQGSQRKASQGAHLESLARVPQRPALRSGDCVAVSNKALRLLSAVKTVTVILLRRNHEKHMMQFRNI